MKLLNNENLIPSVLALSIAVFSILLYRDLNRKQDLGARKVIGTLKYKEKVIQRKFDGQVIWETVDKDIPITNRDSIKSASYSSAVIELEDKTEIKLEENSMIVLDFSEKSINIDFEYGSLSANRSDTDTSDSSTLNIKSGEQVIELKKSDVKLVKTEGENLDMTVEKGNATVKTNGKEQVVEKDQILTVKENIVDIKPVSIKSVSPTDNAIFFSKSNISGISFNWEASENAADTVLVIGTDHKFSRGIQSFKITGKSAVQPLKTGIYYWKITAKDGKGGAVNSEIRKLILQKEESITLFYPIDRSHYSYTSTPPIINISWTKSEFASSYKIEISRDRDFGTILQTMTALTHKFAIDNLEEGNYYIRVTTKPSSPSISPITSNTNFFSIDRKRILHAPELKNESASVSAPVLEKGAYVLNWKDSPEYKSYEVQIAGDKEFNQILQNGKSERNYFVPDKNLQKGKYFWRVKGIAGDGETSDYSVSALEVRDPVPLEFTFPGNNETFTLSPADQIVFRWKKPDAYGTFKIEISDRENFSSIIKTATSVAPSAPVNGFLPGKYYYRLILMDSEKEPVLTSSIRTFSVAAPVTAPVLKYPIKNATVDMTDIDELKFEWEPVAEAVSYKVEVYQKTGRQDRLILKEEILGNNYSINDLSLLDEGKFSWKLSARINSQDGNQKTSPASTENFIISLRSSPDQKPVIISPGEQIKE